MSFPESAMGRKPGVLIVDDEPAVRVVLSVGLRRLGFPVWEAATGEEAVRIYKKYRDRIEAVLFDVCLPGPDGLATLTRLQAIDPDVICYAIKEHADSHTETELTYGTAGTIHKPFRVSEVVQRLSRQLLPSG
jgi:DNA-binding response OmpR family regulator